MFNYAGSISAVAHQIIKFYCPNKGLAFDATLGNGYDTHFLATSFKKVIAMDIQPSVVEKYSVMYPDDKNVELICDSHSMVDRYITSSIDCATYNLGYCPGGDKTITTLASSTLESIQKVLPLLSEGGVATITFYPGHYEGAKEKEFIMEYLRSLPKNQYGVMEHRYVNRTNNPPSLVIIEKSIIR